MKALDPETKFHQAQEQARQAFGYVNESYMQALDGMEALESENESLKAENESLRKLAADMWRGIILAYNENSVLEPYAYAPRIEKLGIEVE